MVVHCGFSPERSHSATHGLHTAVSSGYKISHSATICLVGQLIFVLGCNEMLVDMLPYFMLFTSF